MGLPWPRKAAGMTGAWVVAAGSLMRAFYASVVTCGSWSAISLRFPRAPPVASGERAPYDSRGQGEARHAIHGDAPGGRPAAQARQARAQEAPRRVGDRGDAVGQ